MTIRAKRLWLTLIGAGILIFGLLGAVTIYVTAADQEAETLAYEFVDGVAYPILASASKSYRHDLERFGGKSAILADDIQRWFGGLWHGKRLAYPLALLSVVVGLGCLRAARRRPGDDSPRTSDTRRR